MREVSDSLHLRRFCLIALDMRVPDESTIRKLTRRLGHETVDEITRLVIAKAQRETRFIGRAVRVDSTVIEADIRYPSDAMLALQGTRALARVGRKLARMLKGATATVSDRSRSVGRAVRQVSKTLARRTGEAKRQVIDLNSKAGAQIVKSAREARKLAAQARRAARGRGAKTKLRAAAHLEQLAERCEKVAEQISRRARGFILPAATRPGNPAENTLLPDTMTELDRLGIRPRELVCDGGFQAAATRDTVPGNTSVFISGRHEPGSRRTRKRQARYRTGIEGRISHLKRG